MQAVRAIAAAHAAPDTGAFTDRNAEADPHTHAVRETQADGYRNAFQRAAI